MAKWRRTTHGRRRMSRGGRRRARGGQRMNRGRQRMTPQRAAEEQRRAADEPRRAADDRRKAVNDWRSVKNNIFSEKKRISVFAYYGRIPPVPNSGTLVKLSESIRRYALRYCFTFIPDIVMFYRPPDKLLEVSPGFPGLGN